MPIPFPELRALFREMRTLPPQEQARRLAEVESTLAEELRRLLAADASDSALDAPLPDAPPERLGEFRVLREIGRGGMGIVYEAEQGHPRRRVALKTLHPRLRAEAAHALFRREVQAMVDVDHPGIPHVYEVFEVSGAPVVAMELVTGRRISEAAAGQPLDSRVQLLAGVAAAVGHAHRRGVVHRDIKPGNVLVTADNQPKVIDFGIARLADGEGPRGAGTPAYMAPEQLAGEDVDARADVFALGVLGHEILTGALPPQVAGRVSPVGREMRARAIPADLRAVLGKALAASPADRYPSASELADDLVAWREGRPVRALGRSPGGVLRAWARRRRRELAVLAGVSVLGGLGAWVAKARQNAAQEAVAVARESAADARYQAARSRAARTGAEADWDQAWAAATKDSEEQEALAGMAEGFAWRGRWSALSALLSALPAQIAREERATLALARWDLGAAIPELVASGRTDAPALLAPFASMRPVGPAVAGRFLDGNRLFALNGQQAEVRDLDGAVLSSFAFEAPVVHPTVLGDHAWLVVGGDVGGDVVSLDLRTGARQSLGLPRSQVACMTAGDLDRDGRVELYLTRPHPYRDLLVSDAPGAPLRPLHLGTDAAEMERCVALVDLDGDGVQELLTGGAGARTGDLRRIDGAPKNPHVTARFRVHGSAADAGRLPGGGRFVAIGADRAPGEPALVRVVSDGAFRFLDAVAVPAPISDVRVADLDGDGIDDVLANARLPTDEPVLLLLRQSPDGTLAPPVSLPGLELLDVGQADSDPAAEIWVSDGRQSWIAGLDGGAPLATRALMTTIAPVPPAPPSEDPHAARAEKLASLGMPEEAGELLLALSEDAGAVPARALALLAAAGSPRALDAARRVAPSAPADPELRAQTAAALGERLDIDGLRTLAKSGPAPGWDQTLQALGQPITVGFDRPLARSWQILSPGTVRRHPLDGTLALSFTGDRGTLAALPLNWDGRALDVSVDLDVDELEWGASLDVEVEIGDWRKGVRLWHVGSGPEATHQQLVTCDPGRVSLPLGDLTGPRTIGFTLVGGRISCRSGDERSASEPAPVPSGPARLVLRAPGDLDGAYGFAALRLHTIHLAGATLADAPGDAPALGVAEGDPAAVQAARRSPDPLVAALADGEVGAVDEAPMGRLSAADLRYLLRADAAVWAGTLRHRLGAGFSALFAEAWQVALAYNDAALRDAVRDPALAALPTDTPAGRALVTARADALLGAGDTVAAEGELARLRRSPNAAEAWWLTARLRFRRGDVPGARAAVLTWLAEEPDPEVAQDRLAEEPDLGGLFPELAAAPSWP